jgi:hypothetical protein
MNDDILPPAPSRPPAVIVNVDAVLDHRPSPVDGYGLSRRCAERPNKNIVAVIRAMHVAGHKVILLTSTRTTTSRPTREAWIREHIAVPWERFDLRRAGDLRDDADVMAQLYVEHIKLHYDITCVIDHQPLNVPMWQGLGLDCLHVRQAALPAAGAAGGH